MPSYISRSALEAFIAEIAATHCPGLDRVTIEPALGTPNWCVTGIVSGDAETEAARAAVGTAVAANRSHWVLVPDGDPRAGRPVSLHSSDKKPPPA